MSRIVLVALTVLTLGASAARAQSDAGSMPRFGDEVRSLGHDVTALPSRENAIWSGVGAGTTVAFRPFDDNVTRWFADADQRAVHNVFLPGKFIGRSSVQVGIAGATYLIGRLADRPNTASAGYDMIRADLITEGLVQALKFTVRRMRPDGSNRLSFPSGHAAMTFATATVMERRFGWLQSIPAYLIASYVAAARVTEDKHYVSDVIAGGFVGVIAARTVTRDIGTAAQQPSASTAARGIVFVLTF